MEWTETEKQNARALLILTALTREIASLPLEQWEEDLEHLQVLVGSLDNPGGEWHRSPAPSAIKELITAALPLKRAFERVQAANRTGKPQTKFAV